MAALMSRENIAAEWGTFTIVKTPYLCQKEAKMHTFHRKPQKQANKRTLVYAQEFAGLLKGLCNKARQESKFSFNGFLVLKWLPLFPKCGVVSSL